MCSNLALAAMHGFTASRIDWGPGGASINGFHCPPHSWYAVDIQKQIPYLSTEQGGKILPAQGSWLLHRYGTAGSEIQRSGLIRPLAFLYAFKRLSMVWYARYLEKFGTPAVAAKISERWEDVDNKVRADVGELLSLWSNDASFIVPQDFELSFLAPQQGGADQYLQSLKYFQSQAWRLLLGQDMTSTGASSNRASAEVGKSISYSIMQHEAQALSETLTAQLIKPIIQNAYGFTANAPRFKFMLQTPDDLQAKAAALQMMGQAGYMLADDNIARQFLGYPIVRIQPAAVAHPAATSPEPAK